MSLWEYYEDIEKFDKLSEERQNEIINVLLSKSATSYYNYSSTVSNVIEYLTNEEIILKLFNNFINNCSNYVLSNECSFTLILKVCEKISDTQHVKDAITKSKVKTLHRVFLLLNDKTDKEEELGLRALSGLTHGPDILYIHKYKPSLNAMKNLPPIMRINALEVLLSHGDMAYNILENFSDEDEFRELLFGAVLRHRDRVESICEKYVEIKHLDKDSTVLIKCTCENCGEYEISVKSTRVKTKIGFDSTRISGWITGSLCSLCGRWGNNEKHIKYEG